MSKAITTILLIAIFFNGNIIAQTDSTKATKPKEDKTEIKWAFNQEGTHYVKFTGLAQTWIRQTQNNIGSSVNGANAENTFDIGLRRVRFQIICQLTDRIFFYAQFGTNNYSFLAQRKFGFFLHDALGEYAFIPQIFSFGAGLASWKGPLRYSAPGAGTIMGLDPPIYQQVTNDINDQFVRNLMIYAKGKINKLDYRISLGKPLIVNDPNNISITGAQASIPLLGSLGDNKSTFSVRDPSLQFSSYFSYQLFDKEPNIVAYKTGTYLGTKKIFNLGGGFQYQKNAMWHTKTNNEGRKDTVSTPLVLGGLDIYIDRPISTELKDAISIYAAWLYSDYGPNYIRNLGVMNPTDGKLALSGYPNAGGNAFPMNGSGHTFSLQTGYKFKNNLFSSYGTMMPYFNFQASRFDALSSWMLVFDIGINWLLNGHQSKFTLDYQNRPTYNLIKVEENGRMGMIVLQYHISF